MKWGRCFLFTSSKWKTEVPRITVFSQAVSFLTFCSSINSFCRYLWHAIYNTSCVIVHVPCYIVILANVINVAFVILLIAKTKKLLSTGFLLLNVFITNMICAVGFCLPLYQYYVGNKKYSLCQGNGYIVFASVSNEIVTLQMLSLHQNVIVTRPFFEKTLKSRQGYVIICIIISWLFGLLVVWYHF